MLGLVLYWQQHFIFFVAYEKAQQARVFSQASLSSLLQCITQFDWAHS
jgi:hypothetical protein